MLAGPRLAELTAPPPLPARRERYGQAARPEPRASADARSGRRAGDRRLAVPLYAVARFAAPLPRRARGGPGFLAALSPSGARRTAGVSCPHAAPAWSWHFFLLGAGFMLLETKSIVQFALLWGSTWSSASLAIASVLVMALASALVAGRVEIRRRGSIAAALLALIALNYFVPVGRVTFESRAAESLFYGLLVFSPVFCAGLLFSSSFKRVLVDGDRFRREPARRDGRRRRRVSLAPRRLSVSADPGRRVLPGGDRDRGGSGSRLDAGISDCGLRIAD